MKRAAVAEEHNLSLEDGQSIMQVVSLRGSNLIEVWFSQNCNEEPHNTGVIFQAKSIMTVKS